ncbi:MAG: AbrB/MazE/SpoVT family DNA-binding domain-containing protein [Planctomycetota bacterium]
MRSDVQIDANGGITIPESLRERLGLRAGDVLVIEEANGCLVLRPSGGGEIEMYTDQRIEEFLDEEAAMSKTLGGTA